MSSGEASITLDRWRPNVSDNASTPDSPQSPFLNLKLPEPNAMKLSLLPPSMVSMHHSSNFKLNASSSSIKKRRKANKERRRKQSLANLKAQRTYDLTAGSTPMSSSENDDEQSLHGQNDTNIKKPFDLTKESTPFTDDSENDVQIIESNVNKKHFTQDSNTKTGTNNNSNNGNNDDIMVNANHNFEKFTLLGIGGSLLRKAGWDGNKKSLYQQSGGPIEQSEKYKALQRGKKGLGYSANRQFQPSLSSLSQPTNHRRIRLSRRRPMNVSSNTMDTAIIILEDDNDKKTKKKRKGRKRKRIEIEEDDDDDDADVVVLDKREVTKRRLNKIPFTTIIDQMQTESEECTKSFINSLFLGKKRVVSLNKMVISLKDSYSQCKIAVPVKGKFCSHLQPFDAKSFLIRPKKYQKCTHCNKAIKREHLIRSIYFQKIFDDLRLHYDESIEQVEICEDGSWKPVVEKKQKNLKEKIAQQAMVDIGDNSRQIQKRQSVIELSSDEGDVINHNMAMPPSTMHHHVVSLLESSDDGEDSQNKEDLENEDANNAVL